MTTITKDNLIAGAIVLGVIAGSTAVYAGTKILGANIAKRFKSSKPKKDLAPKSEALHIVEAAAAAQASFLAGMDTELSPENKARLDAMADEAFAGLAQVRTDLNSPNA